MLILDCTAICVIEICVYRHTQPEYGSFKCLPCAQHGVIAPAASSQHGQHPRSASRHRLSARAREGEADSHSLSDSIVSRKGQGCKHSSDNRVSLREFPEFLQLQRRFCCWQQRGRWRDQLHLYRRRGRSGRLWQRDDSECWSA